MPHASDAAPAEPASVDASQGCGSRTLNAWTCASQTAPCVRNSRRRGERRWRVRVRSVRRCAPPRHSTVRSSGESRAALPTCRRRACLSDGSASRGGSSLSRAPWGGRRVGGTASPCSCCCDGQHGRRANGSRQTGRDDQKELHGGSAGMEVGSQPGSSRATPHHGSLRWACRLPSRAGRNLQEFVGLAAPSTRSAPSPRDMSSASRTFLPRSPAARASARTRPGALAGRCLGRAIAPLGAAWPRQSLTPQPCR